MSTKDTKKKFLKKAIKGAVKEESKAHEKTESKDVESKEGSMDMNEMPMMKYKNLGKK